ncbi:FMN-linked oxidoreductase [Schizophyllum commune H4-8]|uniref:NADH:flavin oxidoreductase/NADH oxidase N-terminal domain-containing protein n=1 Tax=Schizophyllum commune (strain H4-8 / FGSC 9210) TaxID=578458 RepID=D8QD61_SCHCM|nr:FMN-linked oxidoreductase [Schizophyllum commune H4-8]KAI5888855.1 FMN-linked oxidoreductase [Schizophyllum commune H4-8]
MVIPHEDDTDALAQFRLLATAMKGQNGKHALAIAQLNHTGRQSANFIGGRSPFVAPLAPSPVRVGSGKPVRSVLDALTYALHAFLFQTPREMTLEDIDEVVAQFVHGAHIARESGFDGVQLHCAHGYLLSEFLSPKTNRRTDEYSCTSPQNALRLLRRIVTGIRTAEGSSGFAVGVKIGAGDYAAGRDADDQELTPSERVAVGYVSEIASWGAIDFIEISGGDYEKPDFMAASSSRPPFFTRVSKAIRAMLDEQRKTTLRPLIILTGNITTPYAVEQVLLGDKGSSGCADLCGIGRMSVLCPQLPSKLNRELHEEHTSADDSWWRTPFYPMPNLTPTSSLLSWLPKIGLVGAGSSLAWYNVRMRALANGVGMDDDMGPFSAVIRMWLWFTPDDARKLWHWLAKRAVWVLSFVLVVITPMWMY